MADRNVIFKDMTDEKKLGFAKRLAKVSFESQILSDVSRIDNLDILKMISNQYRLLDCPDDVWAGVKASEKRVLNHIGKYGSTEELNNLLLDVGLLECALVEYYGGDVSAQIEAGLNN